MTVSTRGNPDYGAHDAGASSRSPTAFFGVVLALAIPIWALSRFVGVIGALKIPVTDLLLAFTPLAAGAILVTRAEGLRGLAAFLRRLFDVRKLARTTWLLPVLLLAPAIYALTSAAMHLAGHPGAPDPHLARLPIMIVVMYALAIGEEGGWTAYVLDPLQARFGAVGASLIIAAPWWLGHIPSIIEIGGSAGDIAWWIPGAIALRILMTWLHNNTGRCVSSVILFHTLLNAGRSVSYPPIGTHYDPAYQAAGYVVALVAAAVVSIVWGPKTLTGREKTKAEVT